MIVRDMYSPIGSATHYPVAAGGRGFHVVGTNPYLAGQRVRVVLRDGQVLEDRACAFDWSIDGSDADIVSHERVVS